MIYLLQEDYFADFCCWLMVASSSREKQSVIAAHVRLGWGIFRISIIKKWTVECMVQGMNVKHISSRLGLPTRPRIRLSTSEHVVVPCSK